MTVKLTDAEVRYLVSVLRGVAATSAARYERRGQVEAELLIGKLEGHRAKGED